MKERRGRPHRCRAIEFNPEVTRFKPAGIPSTMLERVVLSLDECEALRLADVEGLYHSDAAARMEVSRATFGRILSSARGKVARALIHGMEIHMEGGSVMQKQHTMGPQGRCICASCGCTTEHERGRPCMEDRCPTCGKRMLRENSDHHKAVQNKKRGSST